MANTLPVTLPFILGTGTAAAITPAAIGTGATSGSSTVSGLTATVAPAGISSATVLGKALSSNVITPITIDSRELFGAEVTGLTIRSAGISTTATFGQSALAPLIIIAPKGVSSSLMFGNSAFSVSAVIVPSPVGGIENDYTIYVWLRGKFEYKTFRAARATVWDSASRDPNHRANIRRDPTGRLNQ